MVDFVFVAASFFETNDEFCVSFTTYTVTDGEKAFLQSCIIPCSSKEHAKALCEVYNNRRTANADQEARD